MKEKEEKSIIFYKPITCKHYREEGIVGWCEKRGFTGNAKHFWMFCADCKEWEQKDVKLVSIEKVKQTVQWLLKEIEKEIKKREEEERKYLWVDNLHDAECEERCQKTLKWCKDLIKKAFSGVIEE